MEQLHAHHGHIPAFGKGEFEVQPGQTLEITGDVTHQNIYVDGTGANKATLRLNDGCRLKFQTILLNGPNARIESAGVIACELIVRDLPLDLTNDPEQLGNGIVSISGEAVWQGRNPRQARARVEVAALAGHTFLTFASRPVNWQVGDELWIPDTRQPKTEAELLTFLPEVRRIVGIEITAGNVCQVLLDLPLDHDHLGLRESNGTTRKLFHVANVTQSIVLRSENPAGHRGHTIWMDHGHIDVSGFAVKDMGRTTTAPLHSTIWDAHTHVVTQVGTNQIGRYPWHFHGMPGRPTGIGSGEFQFRCRDFSLVDSPKWGFVVHHSTHFGLIHNFAIASCAGAHIVTETPNVYGNRFEQGIVIASRAGSGQRHTNGSSIVARDDRNKVGGDHWHNRVGLGLASAMQEFIDVALYGCSDAVGLAGFASEILFRPKKRGVHVGNKSSPDAEVIVRQHAPEKEPAYPFLPSSGVELWANFRGVETWTADSHEDSPKFLPGLVLIHNRQPTDLQDQNETCLFDWLVLGDHLQVAPFNGGPNGRTFGLHWKPGYRFGINVIGGEISGYDAAYDGVNDEDYTQFRGVYIDCPVAAYLPSGRWAKKPSSTAWRECTWGPSVVKPLDGNYPKYDLKLWMKAGRANITSLPAVTYEVTPWKDGKDYRLYHYEQHPDFALAPIDAAVAYGDWPPGVYTHAELIARGTPIFGAAVPTKATQAGFAPFWALDITPLPPLTLAERVARLEVEVFGEVYPEIAEG